MFSNITIESFKSVSKNIYKHFHNICLYQLTEFFKLVEDFKKVMFCVLYDISIFLGILCYCVNIFLRMNMLHKEESLGLSYTDVFL